SRKRRLRRRRFCSLRTSGRKCISVSSASSKISCARNSLSSARRFALSSASAKPTATPAASRAKTNGGLYCNLVQPARIRLSPSRKLYGQQRHSDASGKRFLSHRRREQNRRAEAVCVAVLGNGISDAAADQKPERAPS